MNTPKINHTGKARRPARAAWLSKPILTSAAILAALAGRADDECCGNDHDLNSFTFSARMGFNIAARFKNPGHINFASFAKKTPDGLNYNYDDGYVLQDFSGNAGGYTYNWGFDNASQVTSPGTPNNQLTLNRTTSADGVSSPWKDGDLSIGGELVYRRELGNFPQLHDVRWGLEAAGNFATISFNDHAAYTGNVTRQSDTFAPYPDSTFTDPAQGTFMGPGQLLNATPTSSALTSASAIISGSRKINADMLGFRVGPYLEIPVTKNFNTSVSAGLAGTFLNVEASWNETLSVGSSQFPFSGGGRDHNRRFGYYFAGTADYQFAKDWSVTGGVQYQSLANYQQPISGRTVEIDLSNAIFVTLGVSYHF